MPRNHANRLLGYADDARLLIVNADDFGMCELVNEATLRAMQEGVVRSTSLMAPWPGASEAMRMLRENPDVPFGVHLTVVCDMPGYIRDSSLTSVFGSERGAPRPHGVVVRDVAAVAGLSGRGRKKRFRAEPLRGGRPGHEGRCRA
jgi:hypothetical protein